MSPETVRSYLLGQLGDEDSANLEERYFTDREFFLFVRTIETALIRDYLGGGLPAAVRLQFEERYLHNPVLRKRVEEVRSSRPAVRIITPVRLAWAASVLLCAAVSGLWVYWNGASAPALSAAPRDRTIVAKAYLTPGIEKAAEAGGAELPARLKGLVQLVLEIPGRSKAMPYSVRVLRMEDGGWQPVWRSVYALWSSVADGRQQVTAMIEASLLVPGDYLAEVSEPGGAMIDTYNFRVLPL